MQSSSENSQRQYTPGGAKRRIFLMISLTTATDEAVRKTRVPGMAAIADTAAVRREDGF